MMGISAGHACFLTFSQSGKGDVSGPRRRSSSSSDSCCMSFFCKSSLMVVVMGGGGIRTGNDQSQNVIPHDLSNYK